ncbi:glycoside hydrolase family 31 protein [Pseudolysinimonas sp.]|uniref:glycoside hydrolase family 31 protein n=1 Tax=Pseudolysinimonas sp. TaxID=2680009 RepID=UPI003F7DAE57
MTFTRDGDAIVWRGEGETLRVEPWGADAVRVRSVARGDIRDDDFALLPKPETPSSVEIHGDVARLRVGRIVAELTEREFEDWTTGYDVGRCRVAFTEADGRPLLAELDEGGSLELRAREHRPILGTSAYRLTAGFCSPADEHLVGMGLYQQDLIDLKGTTLELAHRNSQSSVPFVISSAGYGFLWHNPAIGRATFGRNRTEWFAESTEQLDYWVTAGHSPREIVRAYADATGHAPMMPDHGLGFWQCKLRYWNQEQLLEVAREHARRGIPLDVIVADFFHWPKMGDYRFEEEFWPDPDAMVAELNELGIELMVSVWPQVDVASENFDRFRRENLLVTSDRGMDLQMAFGGLSRFLDVTNPAAREAVWELCRRNYWEKGVRTFWLDEAEPEYGVYDFDNYRYHLGPNVQVGNLYPQLFARAFSDGMRAEGATDVVNLLRAAWAGSQRYGALVWSGDIHSTWEDLRRQVVAGIHMGAAGIPWFTTDIGGFHDGRGDDPAFVELLIRWFQFGAFSPVMRLHGDRRPATPVRAADGSERVPTGADNEIWSFGDEAYGILRDHIGLRERLRDYLREVMREAHRDGQPVMRGLFHEFPDDAEAWTVGDEYLLGPDLLVAPVLEPGARSRRVYLPAGARWTDLRGGAAHEPGWSTVAAPLESIPVFVRDGGREELRGLR